MKKVIEFAKRVYGDHVEFNDAQTQRLQEIEALIRADEREAIMDEWWMCVQSDLENGVKSLNERAAEKWKKEYPEIAGFAATIEARGNT
jgi:hypothetical protein